MARRAKQNLKAPRRRRQKPAGRWRIGVFGIVVILLLAGVGGLVAALALTYTPTTGDEIASSKTETEKSRSDGTETNGNKAAEKETANSKVISTDAQEKSGAQDKSSVNKTLAEKAGEQDKATDASNKQKSTEKEKPVEKPTNGSVKETASNGDKKAATQTKVAEKSKIVDTTPSSPALIKAPVMAVHRQTRKGLVPKIAKDGKRPLQVYAGTAPVQQGPRIALILSNLGTQRLATTSAIRDLPAAITLAFSPYAEGLQSNVDAARARGHEILVQLPMEPQTYPKDDPGPLALLTGLPVRINLERLDWVLGKFAGHVGVLASMGDRFGDSGPAVRPILKRLNDAGLMYVDNRLATSNTPLTLADEIGLPRVYIDRLIDWRPTRTDIENRLAELEKIAKAQGFAVGQGMPYPVTIERLIVWSQRLVNNGITLVPVSVLAGKQPAIK